MGVMSYEETLDVSCMAVTPACSKGALGTWRSQCSARTLSRDHAALEAGTSSLVNRRGRCVCRSVLKLRRESGKTHEGKPRSEPDWGNPTVRDRRGACGIVVSMGAGLRPNGKLLDRPPDPAVTCAPHFYPDQHEAVERVAGRRVKPTHPVRPATRHVRIPASEQDRERPRPRVIMQTSVRIARHEAVPIRAHAERCEQVALALKVRRVAVTDDPTWQTAANPVEDCTCHAPTPPVWTVWNRRCARSP